MFCSDARVYTSINRLTGEISGSHEDELKSRCLLGSCAVILTDVLEKFTASFIRKITPMTEAASTSERTVNFYQKK
jgi:hypothetical protein